VSAPPPRSRASGPTETRALAALAELGREITGALTAESIATHCVATLARTTAADRIAMAVPDPDGSLRLVGSLGVVDADEALALLRLAADAGPLVFDRDAANALAELGTRPSEPAGAWIGVPLLVGRRAAGAITVATAADGGLVAHASAVVQAVASQAAVALQNTHLLLALSQGKREWEQTADAIADGICIIDDDGTIRRANRRFCALADVPVTDVAGRPWITLIPPTWAAPFQQVINDTAQAASTELRAGDRLFQVTALHLRDAGPASVVLVVADQTEKRRLQEQLIQSEKMSAIGQLIAGVAHDLNNPLASVVGFADYLVEAIEGVPPELIEPLRAIQQEAERAATIVKNLLGFARKQERRRELKSIEEIVGATLLLLRNELMAARIETELDVAPGAPDVCVDVNQVQQVFVNLIHNAAQAIQSAGDGGRIVIRAVPWLDGVAVTVEDDGPGVPAHLAERIFEPFFTTKPAGEGTGLGLSICQGIVKEHGGRLSLVPTNRRGAVFQVELPAGAPAAAPERPAPTVPTRRLRVLVVDDEPHIQHYMRATLEAWGHSVAVAGDGETGLARALAEPFDVIVSDLRMPLLGGREMFERLRAERPEAASRVVFATGDTVRGDTLEFLEAVGWPYLRKPFTLIELRAALADAVRRVS
jgi:two-component system NtrC family sensor kinase